MVTMETILVSNQEIRKSSFVSFQLSSVYSKVGSVVTCLLLRINRQRKVAVRTIMQTV